MREIFRPAVCALSVACLALAISAVSSGEVMAQAKQAPPKQSAPAQAAPPPAAEAPAVKQIALTEKQVEGVLAAQKDVDAITDKIPDERQAGSEGRRPARRRRQEERFCQLRRIQQRGRQHQPGARRLRSRDQEVCRRRGRAQGAGRPDPGRQEDAGQGQEGSARRSQRGAEVAAAGDREQGQHRYRRRNITTSSPRRSARPRNKPFSSEACPRLDPGWTGSREENASKIKNQRKAPEKSPGLLCLSAIVRVRCGCASAS